MSNFKDKMSVQDRIYEEFQDYEYLTPAEKDIFKGLNTKRAKELQENGIKKAMGIILGMESEKVLEDGSKITITNIERLAARTFQEAMQNPTTSKLKDIAHIMGEDKLTVETKIESGTDIFLGIVKGDEEESEITDDSNS